MFKSNFLLRSTKKHIMYCQYCLLPFKTLLVDMRTSFFKFQNQYIDYLTVFEQVKQIDLTQRVNLKICSDCMARLRGEYASKLTPTNNVQADIEIFTKLRMAKDETQLISQKNLASVQSVADKRFPDVKSEPQKLGEVSQLLMDWNLNNLIDRFIQKKIDIFCLKHIDENDIKELVEDLRSRIYFKKSLKDWRSKNGLNLGDKSSAEKATNTSSYLIKVQGPIESSNIDLSTILDSNSPQIKIFLQYVKKAFGDKVTGLNCIARTYLMNAIAGFFIEYKMQMRPDDFQRLADQIVENFPDEQTCFYFVPAAGCVSAGGKLYNLFQSMKRKLAKQGLYPSLYVKNARKRKHNESVEEMTQAAQAVTATSAEIEAGTSLKQWLITHDPLWEILESKWRQSAKNRNEEIKKLKNVKEICEQWPKYTGAFGYLLINIDFEYLYPGFSDNLLINWPAFIATCEECLLKKVKHTETLELSKHMNSCQTENARHLNMLCLLHAVLKPCAMFEYTDEHGNKATHRPGITESRESMVMHVKNQADVAPSIAEFRESYEKLKLRVQPFVIAVGPTLASVTTFLTVVDNLVLEFNSLANALDSCFKSIWVFSLEYQRESTRVWRFLQEHFFWPLEKSKENGPIIMVSESMKSKS